MISFIDNPPLLEPKKYLAAMLKLDQTTRNSNFAQACITGDIDKMRVLLDNKELAIDIYYKDINGQDAFRLACVFNHINIIEDLIFKYHYKISKRNLNYLVIYNEHSNYGITKILELLEVNETQLKLNKKVAKNNKKSKVSKI